MFVTVAVGNVRGGLVHPMLTRPHLTGLETGNPLLHPDPPPQSALAAIGHSQFLSNHADYASARVTTSGAIFSHVAVFPAFQNSPPLRTP